MPKKHTVKPGDCISSIAFMYGLFADTIWNHQNNAELKQKRKDPNVLLPDDVVFIPDLRQGEHQADTGQRHRFKRKGVPAMFSLRLLDGENKPRANVAYRLEIDDSSTEGKTDANGVLEMHIPPNTRTGKLIIDETFEEYELSFGELSPISEEIGVRQRLKNLKYLKPNAGQEEFKAAVIRFKIDHCGLKIPDDGVDEATYEQYAKVDKKMRDKLIEIHGS